MESRLWWITGGGSGIGQALAQQVAAKGDMVVVSGRRLAALQDTAAASPKIVPLALDCTDAQSVAAAVVEIEARFGPIDVAILNAAQYRPMELADFDCTMFRHIVDTNLIGVANCLDPLFRHMRLRKRGQIAVIASVAGYRGLPKAAAYGASKAALINMVEALKPNADADGIKLQIVNPGFVETPMTLANNFPMPFLVNAAEAAQRILRGLGSNRFEIAFPWPIVMLMKVGRLLPSWLYFAITRRMVQQ